MKHGQAGLTLVELLVGLALMALLLTALSSFFVQSSRASVQSSARADLQQEALNAQQIITGRLKEAYYVFPSSTSFNFGNGALRKNPSTSPSSGNWKVETTQPILAMILPPKVASATSSCATGTTDGCYRFFAYYAVKRSQWEGNTTGAQDPGADSSNTDTWVLAEYRDHYISTLPPVTSPTNPPISSATKVYLLMDYLAPSTANTEVTAAPQTARAYTMFNLTPSTGAVQRVTINLASARQVNGRLMRLPAANSEYSISVTPTNLGKIAAP